MLGVQDDTKTLRNANEVLDTGGALIAYLRSGERPPLFLLGDALKTLASFPPDCIDCCMTSPPYWGQRAYSGGGIGLEETHGEYIENLLAIIAEVRRVLYWTRLPERERRTWWPSGWIASPSGLSCPASIFNSLRRGAGSSCDESRSIHQ